MVEELSLSMQNLFALEKIEKTCFGSEAWSLAVLKGEFLNTYSKIFAYIENGNIAGYVCFRTMYEEIQICSIAVLPEYRRRKFAASLLTAVKNHCRTLPDAERIELEVNCDNEAALSLYTLCGFQKVGLRKNFYRKTRFKSRDAYTMIYELKPEKKEESTPAETN